VLKPKADLKVGPTGA
jgi:hypothetical protein